MLEQGTLVLIQGRIKHSGNGVISKISFGKKTASELQKICQRERARLARLEPVLRWRADYATLKNRVSEADGKAKSAKKSARADKKSLLGIALSGYRECQQMSRSMPSGPKRGATRKVRSLGKTCKKRATRVKKKIRKAGLGKAGRINRRQAL